MIMPESTCQGQPETNPCPLQLPPGRGAGTGVTYSAVMELQAAEESP